MKKSILEVPRGISFIAYLLNSNYEKLVEEIHEKNNETVTLNKKEAIMLSTSFENTTYLDMRQWDKSTPQWYCLLGLN